MSEKTAVYLAYDASRTLLYVGLARNWGVRWAQHSQRDFFPHVATLEIEWHDSAEAAVTRERELIASRRPRHNVKPGGEGARRSKIPPGYGRGPQSGDCVAIAMREAFGRLHCMVGEVQGVTRRGIQITLIDWIVGMASGYDFFIPWSNVLGIKICTKLHDWTYVLRDFGKFQTRLDEAHEANPLVGNNGAHS